MDGHGKPRNSPGNEVTFTTKAPHTHNSGWPESNRTRKPQKMALKVFLVHSVSQVSTLRAGQEVSRARN